MAIKTKTVYVTTDDQEFDNQSDATAHQENLNKSKDQIQSLLEQLNTVKIAATGNDIMVESIRNEVESIIIMIEEYISESNDSYYDSDDYFGS